MQPVERRHLLAAWHAPGRPNVEEHDLAAKIVQTPRPTIGILELDLGNRFGCFMDDETPAWLLRSRN
ncbi:hypothetical protein ACF1BQ_006330 [Bradyrhizobium sp. RDT10]